MDSEFLTAEEVAEYLRLPLSTVYKLVQDKRLPGFKVGKHWRFRKDSIEKWINDQERKNDLTEEVKFGKEKL
ncbi:MAG: helix-turn-helix domain-containing protein [Anaerolineaceae bacterium]